MEYDVLIAGGGPAGMTAAIYSGRGGWSTIVLDPMGGGGQASTTDMIYNYPGFPDGVPGPKLMELMTEQASQFGVKIQYDQVKEVIKSNGRFRVEADGREYTAKSVIYAAGTTPRKLGVPGEERFLAKGISFCATCDGALFKDRVVAVVGGGDSALTEAEFLTRFARQVLLIHRRDEFRAGMAAIKRVQNNPKIRILVPKVVQEVKGQEVLESLILRDTQTGQMTEVKVDGMFIYVGWEPNSSAVASLVELSPRGFVLTKEDMSTSTPGLFVAGDIREKPLRQVSTAISDGAIAAWSAERFLLESASQD